jgi:hypothetical protein
MTLGSSESQGTMGRRRNAIFVRDLSFLPYTVRNIASSGLCQELKRGFKCSLSKHGHRCFRLTEQFTLGPNQRDRNFDTDS